MPIALVLLNVDPTTERELLDRLKSIEEVKEAYSVFGVYDYVVKMESEERKRVEDIIVWEIRKLDGVRQTITMWVYEGFNKKEE